MLCIFCCIPPECVGGGKKKKKKADGNRFSIGFLFEVLMNSCCAPLLPCAQRPGVNVDKTGARIVAYPSLVKTQGDIPHMGDAHSLDPDVQSLSLHVIALTGDPAVVTAEPGVGAGRTVSGEDDVLWMGSRQTLVDEVELVKQGGIDGMDGIVVGVAAEVIDGPQSGAIVVAILPEGDFFQKLSSVGTVERQYPLPGCCGAGHSGKCLCREKQGGART